MSVSSEPERSLVVKRNLKTLQFRPFGFVEGEFLSNYPAEA